MCLYININWPVSLPLFVPCSCSCQNHCFICNFTGYNLGFSYRSYDSGFLNIYCTSGSTLHVFRITYLCFIGLIWLHFLLSLINWIFIRICLHIYTLFGFISTNGYYISALYILLVISTNYWMTNFWIYWMTTFWIWHYWISVAPTLSLSLFAPYPERQENVPKSIQLYNTLTSIRKSSTQTSNYGLFHLDWSIRAYIIALGIWEPSLISSIEDHEQGNISSTRSTPKFHRKGLWAQLTEVWVCKFLILLK